MRTVAIASLLLTAVMVHAEESSAAKLQAIRDADQADRASKPIDWSVVGVRDRERRAEVLKILRSGGVRTDGDFYNAALVFQHGEDAEEIQLANALATSAAAINPENKSAKWLAAASWDRVLMRMGKPQWYGTQYVRKDDKWTLYEIDESAVTDEQRQRNNVPPLAEAKAFVAELNRE